MARNYNRLIRFYDSWFDDLTDPEKGFTLEEVATVLLTIRKCEHELTTEHLATLPPAIRRGLQMNTLREQVERIIETIGKNVIRAEIGAEVKRYMAIGLSKEDANTAVRRLEWQQQRAAECGMDVDTWRREKLQQPGYMEWLIKNRNTMRCKTQDEFKQRCTNYVPAID